MLLPGGLEPRLRLMRQGFHTQLAFARQRTFIQQLTELALIVRRVKAAVETAGEQLREQLLRLGDERRCMIHITAFPHDTVLKDELMLVLDHAERHAELLPDPGLALYNPAGCGSKIENTFSSCGIFSSLIRCRVTCSSWRRACSTIP